MDISAGAVWLALGVVFLALEAFGAPGMGLLFAGIGALVAGMLIQAGLIAADEYMLQCIAFALGTAAAALVLWKPLQNFRIRMKNKPSFENLLGSNATVTGGALIKGREGQVRWSGTLMKAEIVEDAPVSEIPDGSRVSIVETRGSLLMVAPIIGAAQSVTPPATHEPNA